MNIEISQSLLGEIRHAAGVAYDELRKLASMDHATNGPTETFKSMDRAIVKFCDMASGLIEDSLKDKIETAVRENTRRIVLAAFDKFMDGAH